MDLATALIVKVINTYNQWKVSFVVLDFYGVFGGWIKLARFLLDFALACWCLGMDKNERLNKYTLQGEAASYSLKVLDSIEQGGY